MLCLGLEFQREFPSPCVEIGTLPARQATKRETNTLRDQEDDVDLR